MPHLRENFLAENFCRRSITKAFARCCVEPAADFDQVRVGERQGIDLSRKPFSHPAVGVLDGTFLLRRLWITEPCLGTDARLKIGPVSELGSAVERDRLAGEVGQGLKCTNKAIHNGPGLPVVVA